MPTAVWIKPLPLPPAVERRLRTATQAVIDFGTPISEVADRAVIDVSNLNGFLKGRRPISTPAAARLCEAVGLRLTYTLEPARRADEPKTPARKPAAKPAKPTRKK